MFQTKVHLPNIMLATSNNFVVAKFEEKSFSFDPKGFPITIFVKSETGAMVSIPPVVMPSLTHLSNISKLTHYFSKLGMSGN